MNILHYRLIAKKASLLILVLNIFVYPAAYANNISISEKIAVELKESKKSGDFSKVTATLKNARGTISSDKATHKEVNKIFIVFSNSDYATTDPLQNAKLYTQIILLYPDNYDFAVKYFKSVVETMNYKWGVAVLSHISSKFTISGDITDNHLKAASLAFSALASLNIGSIDLAKQYSENAISADPQWTGGYFMMSGVYMRENDPENAIKNLKKVTDLNPSHKGAINLINMLSKKAPNN